MKLALQAVSVFAPYRSTRSTSQRGNMYRLNVVSSRDAGINSNALFRRLGSGVCFRSAPNNALLLEPSLAIRNYTTPVEICQHFWQTNFVICNNFLTFPLLSKENARDDEFIPASSMNRGVMLIVRTASSRPCCRFTSWARTR